MKMETELINIRQNHNYYDERYFLICQRCYWCSSDLAYLDRINNNDRRNKNCPICKLHGINSIPLLKNIHKNQMYFKCEFIRDTLLWNRVPLVLEIAVGSTLYDYVEIPKSDKPTN